MDILTIVLACSLHFDDELVTALIHRVSNDNPLLVGDLVTLETRERLSSVPEATAAVADILKRGGRPAVGLMALPVTWAARYGRDPEDLFDSCTNVSVGTAILSEYDHLCRTRDRAHTATARRGRHAAKFDRERSRTCILRHLGSDLGVTGYAEGVKQEIASRRLRPPDAIGEPLPAQSPIVPLDDGSPNVLPMAPIHVPSLPIAAPSNATSSASQRTNQPLTLTPRTTNAVPTQPYPTAVSSTAKVSDGAVPMIPSTGSKAPPLTRSR